MKRLSYLVVFLAVLFIGGSGLANSYRVLLLGDTHYDGDKDVYHSACYANGKKPPHYIEAEFARNSAMWKERNPKLVASAYSKKTADTSFVLQLGDLVQGDCGDPVVHTKLLKDTVDYFKKAMPGLPFVSAAGNHDIRGEGARKAYADYMPARMSQELNAPPINAGVTLKKTTFAFRHKKDLYVIVDFNNPDDQVIKDAFKQHADARYKFVVTHGAVLPWDGWGVTYGLYGGKVNKRREAMRKVFSENNVIVLTGHVHGMAYCKYVDSVGSITQLMINSVWMENSPKTLKPLATKPEDVGSNVKRMYKKKTKDLEAYLSILNGFKANLTEYFFAHGAAGYATMDVSDKGVTVTYYTCDQRTPSKVFTLR